MPLKKTNISFPFFSLTSKTLSETTFEKLKIESDRKNIFNKEMITDILMLASLFVAPFLLVLVI